MHHADYSKRFVSFWQKWRSDLPYLLILFGILFAIIGTNSPSSKEWLTGWDNLHPEFNFWLNTKRAFSAVWQEFQGLGLVGGHGYAATLPHTLPLACIIHNSY